MDSFLILNNDLQVAISHPKIDAETHPDSNRELQAEDSRHLIQSVCSFKTDTSV